MYKVFSQQNLTLVCMYAAPLISGPLTVGWLYSGCDVDLNVVWYSQPNVNPFSRVSHQHSAASNYRLLTS